ncbi:MAG: hypothetical protein AAGC72_01080 [Planctomycetota bacterium]
MAKKKASKKKGISRKTQIAATGKIDIDAEAEAVLQLLLEGMNEYQVDKCLRAKMNGDKVRSVMAALVKRLERMGEESEAGVVKGWCYEAYRKVYQRALSTDDLGTALRAVKEIERLAEA